MAASPFWVLLGSTALVSDGDDLISLSLETPPRVVLLTVPRSMQPDTTAHVSVVAANPSGILLHAADETPSAIDRPEGSQSNKSGSAGRYYLLLSELLVPIAIPNPEYIMHPGHVGHLTSPEDSEILLVAELQPPAVDGEQATLLCFKEYDWDRKSLSYPLPTSPPLAPHGVVSHSGRLWWVDLFRCLLTCDPFADAPVLAVVELPPGKALTYKEHRSSLLRKRRCVAASGGKLLIVDMYNNRDSSGARQISVWSLTDADLNMWKLEWEVPFQEIWNHPTYQDTPLPMKTPVLRLVHPLEPYIINFSVDAYIFSVDLIRRRVMEIGSWMLTAPPNDVVTHLVHPWQPPMRCQEFHIDGLVNDSSDEENWSEDSDIPVEDELMQA